MDSSECWEIKQTFVKRFTQDRSRGSLNQKSVVVISQSKGCGGCWKVLTSTNGTCTQAGQARSRRTLACEGRAGAARVTGPVTAARLLLTGCALWPHSEDMFPHKLRAPACPPTHLLAHGDLGKRRDTGKLLLRQHLSLFLLPVFLGPQSETQSNKVP